MEYYVPLELEQGRFVIAPQEPGEAAPEGEFLRLERNESSILEYRHPKYGNEIRLYSVPDDVKIVAAYGESGKLIQVSYPVGDDDLQKLIYVTHPDFSSFEIVTGIKLPRRILQEKGEVSRLFFEYFYDGESADFAVLLGTPAEMAEIRAHYGEDTGAVNNSGDYPHKKRIECDAHTFRILLQCTEPEQRTQQFYDTVHRMMDTISQKVLPKLNKTSDFRVIDAEYD